MFVVGFTVYLVLSLAGINQSNLGVVSMSGQKSVSQSDSGNGHSFGLVRDIRSDEFLRATPTLIGYLRGGNHEQAFSLTIDTPLAFNIPNKKFDYLLFPEYGIAKFSALPLASKFSLIWWLPFLLLLFSLILVGDLLGNSRKLTYFIFCALIFAPGSAWWSHMTIPIFYNFLFAMYFLIKKRGNNWFDIVAPIISGFFIVRAISYYQPWALVFGSVIIFTSVVYLLSDRPIITSVKKIIIMIFSFLIFAAIRFLPHMEGLRSLFQTVYPGQRRSTGGEQSLEFLFSTPFLWRLQFPNLELINTNQSEISSYLILPGLIIFIVQSIKFFKTKSSDARISAGVFGGFLACIWCSWAILDFGEISQNLYLINRVPGFRAAQIIGSCFIFLLMFLYSPNMRVKKLSSYLIYLSGALLTVFSGIRIRETYLPQISNSEIILVSLIVGLMIYLFINKFEHPHYGYILCIFMASIVLFVNPVNTSIGEFDGKISQKLVELNFGEKGVWASDNFYTDSLLISSGIKAISGQQSIGPLEKHWKILDPENKYNMNWNRAASYITFHWAQTESIEISNPSADVILINANPCSSQLKKLNLSFFISAKNSLIYPCAKQITEFQIMGQINVIYKIQ